MELVREGASITGLKLEKQARLESPPTVIGLKDAPQLWVLSISSWLSLSINDRDQALLSDLIIITALHTGTTVTSVLLRKKMGLSEIYDTYSRSQS